MTTYEQLWWDEEFVKRRIQQQKDYICTFRILGYTGLNRPYWWSKDGWGTRKPSRAFYTASETKKVESARAVLQRFERQLEEIKKLKGHCCRY